MVKCDRHIDVNNGEWCWKCQELTDKERFESIKSLNKLQEIKFEDVFNDEKKESLKKFISEHKKDNDHCHYSGLPSPSAYEKNENDWEEILFDFIDFYPCILPNELFEWLEDNYEIPKKKNGKD